MKARNRDEFAKSVKLLLASRVSMRCSNPDCRAPTGGPVGDSDKCNSVGKAAHITAAASGGPRYDDLMSSAQRKSFGNGIWLCSTCADMVDNDEVRFPAEKLQEWKRVAETHAQLEQGKQTTSAFSKQLLDALETLAKQGGVGSTEASALDGLTNALHRLTASGRPRGEAVVSLVQSGNFTDAVKEAIGFAEDETKVASQLAQESSDARTRAARRWCDAGDLAFFVDPRISADSYRRSIEIQPENPYAWSRLGHVLWWLGDHREALNAFTHLWYMLPSGAQSLLMATNAEAAMAIPERFLLAHPREAPATFSWAIRGTLIVGLNIVELLKRQPDLVTDWVLKAVAIGGDGTRLSLKAEDAPAIVDMFLERAYNLGRILDEDAARNEHSRLLEMLARVAFVRGEIERSENYIRRGIELNQERNIVASAGYLNNLGGIAAERGETHTAGEYFDQVLSICASDPAKPRLFMTRDWVTPEEARFRGSAAFNAAYPTMRDDELEVCNRLDEEFDKDPQAATHKALKLKEIEGNAHRNLAKMAEQDGDIDRARQEYSTALAVHDLIGYSLGASAACRALGDLESGQGDLEAAARL